METTNGKREPDDLLAVLRLMFYVVRELNSLGHTAAADEMKATAIRLQNSQNITDQQLFPSQ